MLLGELCNASFNNTLISFWYKNKNEYML